MHLILHKRACLMHVMFCFEQWENKERNILSFENALKKKSTVKTRLLEEGLFS